MVATIAIRISHFALIIHMFCLSTLPRVGIICSLPYRDALAAGSSGEVTSDGGEEKVIAVVAELDALTTTLDRRRPCIHCDAAEWDNHRSRHPMPSSTLPMGHFCTLRLHQVSTSFKVLLLIGSLYVSVSLDFISHGAGGVNQSPSS